MKPVYLIFNFIFFSISSLLAMEPLSEEASCQIESKIELHQKSTQSLRALFTQSVLPPRQIKPVISHGKLLYHQPQTLRIDYDQPAGDGMILTPLETLSWKKGLLTQVTPHDPQKPSFRRVLLDVLEKKPQDWKKDYQRKMTQTESHYEVHLTPLRNDTPLPEGILAKLRLSDLQITEIEVQFSQFNWKIQLNSIELNPSLEIRLQR